MIGKNVLAPGICIVRIVGMSGNTIILDLPIDTELPVTRYETLPAIPGLRDEPVIRATFTREELANALWTWATVNGRELPDYAKREIDKLLGYGG